MGSMAMAAQGLVQATRDLDFFVSPQARNIQRLNRALKSLYDDDPNVDQIPAEDLAGARTRIVDHLGLSPPSPHKARFQNLR